MRMHNRKFPAEYFFLLFLFTFLLPSFFAGRLSAQGCPGGMEEVIIDIDPDNFPQEISWEITAGDSLIASGTYGRDTLCLPQGSCVKFTLYDSADDGICCSSGYGEYNVYINGESYVSGSYYRSYVSHNLLCDPGTVCETSLPVDTGTFEANDNTWYVFVPDTTGRYAISACEDNDCASAIWLYDYCISLSWDESVLSTLAYSTTGCQSAEGAALSAIFEKGRTYYIRIGDVGDDCEGSVKWDLRFEGALVGCLDPAACNYQPFAGINDASLCLYAPDEDCPDEQPDLFLDAEILRSSLHKSIVFNNDPCLIAEGCLLGYNAREVLRFTTRIDNVGNADFVVGRAPDFVDQENNQFEWDECHQHWHFEGYADYLIYNNNGEQLPAGFKNGFCVLDLECNGPVPKYNCRNMGISAGCSDIYDDYLPCQWIDITDFEPGDYTLVVRVNWERKPDAAGRTEVTYDNNWAQVCFKLTRGIFGNAQVAIKDSCALVYDCLGEPLGDARPDCKGDCAGGARHGDLDGDGDQDIRDLEFYAEHIALEPFLDTVSCTDLNQDGRIDITDLVLLNACRAQNLTGLPPANPNLDMCEFPFGLENPIDTLSIRLGEINTEEKFVEVEFRNRSERASGVQFRIDGLDIDRVESSVPQLATAMGGEFGDVLIYAANFEAPFDKHLDFSPLLRVYYNNEEETLDICLGQDAKAMNARREVMTTVADSSCLRIVASGDQFDSKRAVNFYPNPVSDRLFIRNLPNSSSSIEILDLQGRQLFQSDEVLSFIDLKPLRLSAGLYLIRISSGSKLFYGNFAYAP